MIARIWHGKTSAEKADAYVEYVKKTGIDAYRAIHGNRGQTILRKVEGGVADFYVVSLWESMDSVRAFAGAQPEKAVYYPEDDEYLLEREEHVEHFEVVHHSQ